MYKWVVLCVFWDCFGIIFKPLQKCVNTHVKWMVFEFVLRFVLGWFSNNYNKVSNIYNNELFLSLFWIIFKCFSFAFFRAESKNLFKVNEKMNHFEKTCKRLHQGSNQGPSSYWNEDLDHWAMWDDAGKAIETCIFE